MYRIYLCFLSLIYVFQTNAQSYRKDYKEIVTDRVIVNNPDETITAHLKPVKKKVEPEINKNYYWFSAHQIRETQGGYSGKLLNGLYTAFYMNKNLKEQGEFKKGLKSGDWKLWYENGKLKETLSWKSGIRTGRFYQYDESGDLKLKGRFRKGEYNGKISTYIDKDSTNVRNYKAGNPIIEKEKISKTERAKRIYKKLIPKKRKSKDKEDPKGKNETP